MIYYALDFNIGIALESIIITTLKKISKRELAMEWKNEINNFRVIWVQKLKENHFISNILNSNISKIRTHEIESTIKTLKGLKNKPAIFTIANLIIYDVNEKTPLIEFDGIAVTNNRQRKEIVLTIVESKKQMKNAESSTRKDLSNKLRKLRCNDDVNVGRIKSRSFGKKARAWRHLRISYDNT